VNRDSKIVNREFCGAQVPSRASFGALAETPSTRQAVRLSKWEKVRSREAAIASTRGLRGPQTARTSFD
jgi:hypothetical protein